MSKKLKTKIIKAAIVAATSFSVLSAGISASAAKVNLDQGVEQVTIEIKKQVKPIFVSIFGLAAVVLFGIALFKTVHEFSESRSNERDMNWSPIIKWWIGVIVCALASSSAFFGWFGL